MNRILVFAITGLCFALVAVLAYGLITEERGDTRSKALANNTVKARPGQSSKSQKDTLDSPASAKQSGSTSKTSKAKLSSPPSKNRPAKSQGSKVDSASGHKVLTSKQPRERLQRRDWVKQFRDAPDITALPAFQSYVDGLQRGQPQLNREQAIAIAKEKISDALSPSNEQVKEFPDQEYILRVRGGRGKLGQSAIATVEYQSQAGGLKDISFVLNHAPELRATKAIAGQASRSVGKRYKVTPVKDGQTLVQIEGNATPIPNGHIVTIEFDAQASAPKTSNLSISYAQTLGNLSAKFGARGAVMILE